MKLKNNLRLHLLFVLIFIPIASLLSQVNEENTGDVEPDFMPNELLLTFYADKKPQAIVKMNGVVQTGISGIDQIFNNHAIRSMEPLATTDTVFIATCTNCDLDKIIKELSDFNSVFNFVEKNYVFQLSNCSNPINYNDAYPNNSTWDKLEVECGWTFSTGNNSLIGMLDQTGNGLNHNDINSKIVSNTNFHGDTATYHGIWMSGLAGATVNNYNGIAGIGYNADIITYNVASNGGGVPFSDVVDGVNQSVSDGVDVINMSFGWSNSGNLKTAVNNALANNIVVITAAGNQNQSFNSGCSNSGVICVTSVDSNDEHGPTGNKNGAQVDLSAPDRGYWSLGPNNTMQQMFNGTSQSTALVTGAVALMKDVHPGLSPSQARTFLMESADDVSNIGNNGTTYAGLIGSGRLNVYRAVQQAEIYVSQISGDNNLCPNESEYYSVPSFEGASYNWTVTNGSIQNGQGTNQIWFKASSGFSWGQVKCEITVGNASQLKIKTIGLDYGCSGGGYFMSTYPNPAVASQDLVVSMSSDITEEVESLSITPTTYSLYNPYGEQLSSKTSKESVIFSTNGLKEGIYTIIGTNQETSVTSRVFIK